ncbi:type II toxin-antitoxin system RelE/ParE family toxin [Actinoplanes sp. NPDC089786]|uniref:type II toxin-antitoxin system RelE/ParE family toxin n=1 Tax=Actinoplanes sp. NPDC089786 TaxID=3155185 RepID=UPI003426B075
MPESSPRRWSIKTTGDVREWLRALRQSDPDVYRSVNVAIDMLAEVGPGLGRPLVDTLQGSSIANLKELRPRSGRDVAIRVLFVFDPWSQAVMLVAGNKAGDWTRWYRTAIPLAEATYDGWLAEERKRRENS